MNLYIKHIGQIILVLSLLTVSQTCENVFKDVIFFAVKFTLEIGSTTSRQVLSIIRPMKQNFESFHENPGESAMFVFIQSSRF